MKAPDAAHIAKHNKKYVLPCIYAVNSLIILIRELPETRQLFQS